MATTNGDSHTNGTLPALTASAEDFLKHEYDFVIVGGGTAGLTVAARLTENPDVTVGVLETGKNRLNDPMVDTPAAFIYTLNNPEYDYGYKSEAQPNNKGKVHQIPRGKALGGSSAINYMMYVRGSDQDYDDWALLADDPSWGSAPMKEYMRKHQTLEPIADSLKDCKTMPLVGEHHGTSGPVRTSFNETLLPIEDAMIAAADEATGLDKKPSDPWSGDHIGFYNTLALVSRSGHTKGKRSYAARGMFEANAQRPNLHVLCEAAVHKVLVEDGKATGVKFLHDGEMHEVRPSREVIISGGAIATPQILELSGIGDPDVLKAAGVDCLVENKGVGRNYAEHVLSGVIYELSEGNYSLDMIHAPGVMEAAQKQMMESQNGPLTHISSAQGFFPYKIFATQEEQDAIIKSIRDTKDLTPFQRKQYELTEAHLKDDKSANLQLVIIAATMNVTTEGVADQSKLFPPKNPDEPHQALAAICLQYPLSRGSIHIKSSDPSVHPTIDPAFLSHPADTAVLAAGVKFGDRMFNADALKGKLGKRVYPPPEADLTSTEECRAAVEEIVLSEYHACGSCAMGDALDSKLRVKGVEGLRVVDASVFPNNVSGNIVSSVYAVAEKAADIIKMDWDYAALSKTAKA